MKKTGLFLGAVMATALLFSCATTAGNSGASASESKGEGTKVAQKSNHPLGIADDVYQTYLDKSFVTTGNNYRVKKVLEKIRNGEQVYVAALGGSVTEGAGPASYLDGYAYQFNKKLKAAYAPSGSDNIKFDGAGLSGTPSMLGLIRYQADVVDVLGHTPDLLIIEFAVNDDASSANRRAFEQLIRQAYLADENTAVIALYSAATYGNQAMGMKPIADYYGVPQVNVLTLVKAATSAGLFTEKQYYSDYVHPTKEGHEIQADCIMNVLSKIDAEELAEKKDVPEKSYNRNSFDNFARITGDNDDVKIDAGSFKGTDSATQSIQKTKKGNFPQNWYHESGSESFVMDINCKSLLFVYKVQGSWLSKKFGKAEVYVDGKLVDTYDGGAAGGWCNCEPRIIIDNSESASHHVEVKMASGNEGSGFTIVAMGYNK